VAVLATIAIAVVGTFVLMTLVNLTMGAKAGVPEQLTGLDLSEHGEEAYIGTALGESVVISG
jgi:ammonium transporter, Amt family